MSRPDNQAKRKRKKNQNQFNQRANIHSARQVSFDRREVSNAKADKASARVDKASEGQEKIYNKSDRAGNKQESSTKVETKETLPSKVNTASDKADPPYHKVDTPIQGITAKGITSVKVGKVHKIDWKPVIQQYISTFNQAETEQHSYRFESISSDPLHSQRAGQRLQRVRERDLYRGIDVTGSDTKAEIVHVNELDHEAIILLKLHVKRKLKQYDQPAYLEERIDLERIWLRLESNHWVISQIEVLTPERKPHYPITALEWVEGKDDAEEERTRSISKPFINSQRIANIKLGSNQQRYLREQAVAYANEWWNKPNPKYEEFDANCTNYVSQCIFAGDVPMHYTNRRDSGWWYRGKLEKNKEWWSYSWAVSRSLTSFLSKSRTSGLRANEVFSADQLQLGDVIVYDWNGNNTFQHTTIVTAFDSKGQPLVNANTTPSRHRYWDYQDSYAWTPNTRYRFFHINDYI